MMITREDFDRKSFLIRQATLQVWGVLLAKREDTCWIRELYQLDNFFVEICYDKQTNKPTCICSFNSSERLLLYVEPVDLEELRV